MKSFLPPSFHKNTDFQGYLLHSMTWLSCCFAVRLHRTSKEAKLVLKPVTFKLWNHTWKKNQKKNNNNKNQKNKNSTSVSANKNNQETKMLSQNSEKASCGQSSAPLNNSFCSPSLSCLSFPHLLPALHKHSRFWHSNFNSMLLTLIWKRI